MFALQCVMLYQSLKCKDRKDLEPVEQVHIKKPFGTSNKIIMIKFMHSTLSHLHKFYYLIDQSVFGRLHRPATDFCHLLFT